MRGKIIGTAMAGVMAMSAAVFGTAGPALAASRSDGCVEWACGSATFTFDGEHRIRGISMSIKDTLCNGHIAFIRFRVHYVDGTSYTGPERKASSTCGADPTVYNGLAFGPSTKIIRGAQVLVGDEPHGNSGGRYVDNPNHD
jgi:hypothetical protein